MYVSAKYIGIKLNQDFADFIPEGNNKSIVICDGIGEFEESGKAAEIVSNTVINECLNNDDLQNVIFESVNEIKKHGITGGTTLLYLKQIDSSTVKINYLGNGRILHLNGNFHENPLSENIFRFSDLLLPDISPKTGALTKHISHHSGNNELILNEIIIKVNNPYGDIFLLMSDGISSLEECFILKDAENRLWRNESNSINLVMNELHSFLENSKTDYLFQEELIEFNAKILDKLKIEGFLEDDASLGIVITMDVLSYYKKQRV